MSEDIPTAYECRRCWALLPYRECPHNCPEDYEGQDQDDGFSEDLEEFLKEIKGVRVRVYEAPDPEILELIPDQGQGFHVREEGEEVPEGVQPIRVFEVGPNDYRPVENVLAEAREFHYNQNDGDDDDDDDDDDDAAAATNQEEEK